MARTESCRSYLLPAEYRLLPESARTRITDVLCFHYQGMPIGELAAMTGFNPAAARAVIADHLAALKEGKGVLIVGPCYLPDQATIAAETQRLTHDRIDAAIGKDVGPREINPRANVRVTQGPRRAGKLPHNP